MTNQQAQASSAYAYPYPATAVNGYGQAPPPVGYPMKDDQTTNAGPVPAAATTRSRGDGFWKGCCAALCCCCVLDACF